MNLVPQLWGGLPRSAGNFHRKPLTVPTTVRCYTASKLAKMLVGAPHRVIPFDSCPKELKEAGLNRPPDNRAGIPIPQDCFKRLKDPAGSFDHLHLVHIPPRVSARKLISTFPGSVRMSSKVEQLLGGLLDIECAEWNWVIVSRNPDAAEKKSLKVDTTLLLKLIYTQISFSRLTGRRFFNCTEPVFSNYENGCGVQFTFKGNVMLIDQANRPTAPKYPVLLDLVK